MLISFMLIKKKSTYAQFMEIYANINPSIQSSI